MNLSAPLEEIGSRELRDVCHIDVFRIDVEEACAIGNHDGFVSRGRRGRYVSLEKKKKKKMEI